MLDLNSQKLSLAINKLEIENGTAKISVTDKGSERNEKMANRELADSKEWQKTLRALTISQNKKGTQKIKLDFEKSFPHAMHEHSKVMKINTRGLNRLSRALEKSSFSESTKSIATGMAFSHYDSEVGRSNTMLLHKQQKQIQHQQNQIDVSQQKNKIEQIRAERQRRQNEQDFKSLLNGEDPTKLKDKHKTFGQVLFGRDNKINDMFFQKKADYINDTKHIIHDNLNKAVSDMDRQLYDKLSIEYDENGLLGKDINVLHSDFENLIKVNTGTSDDTTAIAKESKDLNVMESKWIKEQEKWRSIDVKLQAKAEGQRLLPILTMISMKGILQKYLIGQSAHLKQGMNLNPSKMTREALESPDYVSRGYIATRDIVGSGGDGDVEGAVEKRRQENADFWRTTKELYERFGLIGGSIAAYAKAVKFSTVSTLKITAGLTKGIGKITTAGLKKAFSIDDDEFLADKRYWKQLKERKRNEESMDIGSQLTRERRNKEGRLEKLTEMRTSDEQTHEILKQIFQQLTGEEYEERRTERFMGNDDEGILSFLGSFFTSKRQDEFEKRKQEFYAEQEERERKRLSVKENNSRFLLPDPNALQNQTILFTDEDKEILKGLIESRQDAEIVQHLGIIATRTNQTFETLSAIGRGFGVLPERRSIKRDEGEIETLDIKQLNQAFSEMIGVGEILADLNLQGLNDAIESATNMLNESSKKIPFRKKVGAAAGAAAAGVAGVAGAAGAAAANARAVRLDEMQLTEQMEGLKILNEIPTKSDLQFISTLLSNYKTIILSLEEELNEGNFTKEESKELEATKRIYNIRTKVLEAAEAYAHGNENFIEILKENNIQTDAASEYLKGIVAEWREEQLELLQTIFSGDMEGDRDLIKSALNQMQGKRKKGGRRKSDRERLLNDESLEESEEELEESKLFGKGGNLILDEEMSDNLDTIPMIHNILSDDNEGIKSIAVNVAGIHDLLKKDLARQERARDRSIESLREGNNRFNSREVFSGNSTNAGSSEENNGRNWIDTAIDVAEVAATGYGIKKIADKIGDKGNNGKSEDNDEKKKQKKFHSDSVAKETRESRENAAKEKEEKRLKKEERKAAQKTLAKSAIKKIPGIGLMAGLIFGAGRALSGDLSGAAMEIASGGAGTIPGAGTAASVGIDAALAKKDLNAAEKISENIQTEEVPDGWGMTTAKLFVPAYAGYQAYQGYTKEGAAAAYGKSQEYVSDAERKIASFSAGSSAAVGGLFDAIAKFVSFGNMNTDLEGSINDTILGITSAVVNGLRYTPKNEADTLKMLEDEDIFDRDWIGYSDLSNKDKLINLINEKKLDSDMVKKVLLGMNDLSPEDVKYIENLDTHAMMSRKVSSDKESSTRWEQIPKNYEIMKKEFVEKLNEAAEKGASSPKVVFVKQGDTNVFNNSPQTSVNQTAVSGGNGSAAPSSNGAASMGNVKE